MRGFQYRLTALVSALAVMTLGAPASVSSAGNGVPDVHAAVRIADHELVLGSRVLAVEPDFEPDWPAWGGPDETMAFVYRSVGLFGKFGSSVWTCGPHAEELVPVSYKTTDENEPVAAPSWSFGLLTRDLIRTGPNQKGHILALDNVDDILDKLVIPSPYMDYPQGRPVPLQGVINILYWVRPHAKGADSGESELHFCYPTAKIDNRLVEAVKSPGPGAWSPEGRWFAFVKPRDGDNSPTVGDLAVGDMFRRPPMRQLTTGIDVDYEQLAAFSPSGKSIAFTGKRGSQRGIWVANVKTGQASLVVEGNLRHLSWSDKNELAAVTDAGKNRSKILIFRMKPDVKPPKDNQG